MLAGPECTIDLSSAGGDDPWPLTYHARANGASAGTLSVGINIMEVNLVTCTLGPLNKFDTYTSSTGVTNMINFLNALPVDDTIYAGVMFDEASNNLHAHGGSAALLATFGVDITTLAFRESFTFLAKKGDPSFATTVYKGNGLGPARIMVTVRGE